MANKKARVNDKDGGTVGSLQTVRVPFFLEEDYGSDDNYSSTVGLSAQYFINCYLEAVKNKETQSTKYRAVKRPGLVSSGGGPITLPLKASVTGLRGRGIYYWNSNMYSIWGTTIYSNGTLLYTGLNSNTTLVSFSETQPDAVTQYLCINDGSSLYLIDLSNNVLVMNNVVVNTSSVAAASVITTATAHGLATGNRVIIRNHVGSTPSINDTIYTVTVLTATTFSIPVNVTVAGAGGTIGIFPTNVGSLEFLDGYMFVGNNKGRIYNCNYNDPTTWTTTSYITVQMQNDDLVGLGRQNNYLVAFKERSIQFLYDKGDSIVGQTPLANAEQAMQQIGCWSRQSIVSNTNTMYWVGNSRTGQAAVFKLEGTTNIKEVSNGYISRALELTSGQAQNNIGSLITANGQEFYCVQNGSLTIGALVYNNTSDTWSNWKNNDVTANVGTWPVSFSQISDINNPKYLYCQDTLSGQIYVLSSFLGMDLSSNIIVKIAIGPISLDTNKRKYWERVEIIIDNLKGTTESITLNYTDDIRQDPNFTPQVSYSWTATNTEQFNRYNKRANGNSRKRMYGITHTGSAANTKYICLEMDVRISEY